MVRIFTGTNSKISLNVCNMEGIGLEVVLSQDSNNFELSSCSVVPCSIACRGGVDASGLNELMGGESNQRPDDQSTGVVVSKDRGDACHIIDIQEDIGMNFKGEGDEDVIRCMNYEERDRVEKMAQVQNQGFQ
ncbi:hypothetical protein P8452_55061 [Trifolium repens]|nr:hypothetical protein P8452_55061 [Trifolium repens]